MRQLHVVALSEDGRSVLLATSKSAKTGGFSLPLDAKLAAALRGDLPRPGEREVRDVGVTPKEIQSRLRAGESPEQIAHAAGVPVARVERFAGPVLSERERIIDEAQAAYVSRSRRGASQLPLGDAVAAALAETSSLRPESVTWTARRLESGHWLVQVSYVARARTRTASWVYEPHIRAVTASDAASAALGHVGDEPAPRRVPAAARPRTATRTGSRRATRAPARKPVPARPAKAPAPAAKEPAARAAKKVPAKRTAAQRSTAKAVTPRKAVAARPVAAKRAVAKPVAAKQSVAKRPVAKRAVATRAQKPVATKPVATKPVATKPVATKPVATQPQDAGPIETDIGPGGAVREPVGPPALRVVPEPVTEAPAEPTPAEPTPAEPTPAPKRRAAGERAHVPDWADVLLGIAPHSKRTDG